MNARKNLCSGCGYNFGSTRAFDAHRTGPYNLPGGKPTPVGKSPRRCMTVEEMQAKGFVYSEPLVTFHTDGKPYKKATPTWNIPLTEKEKEHIEKLQQKRV